MNYVNFHGVVLSEGFEYSTYSLYVEIDGCTPLIITGPNKWSDARPAAKVKFPRNAVHGVNSL